MRVAIDATPLALSSGGIGRYVRELSRALAEEFPDDQFTLISDQPYPDPPAAPSNLHRGEPPRGGLERRWWSWGVQRAMRRSGATLFHGTHFAVPWLPLRPSVVTLHDMSPWLNPEWQAGASFVRRRAPCLIGLGLATRVITPSQAIRREAMDRFRIHPARISAVPLAAASHFRPSAPPPRPRPYLLHVAVNEPRKNLGMLVAAWREVHRRLGTELLLAGPLRFDGHLPAPEPGLQVLGEVPDADLPGLYSGAVACLYPSLYEGFGLPVLEAMQCGAAVIASRDQAVMEVAGDAALLLDARDARAWVEAMCAAAGGGEDISRMRARSLQRAALYSWARTARLTREVYLDALDAFGV